MYAVIRTGGKQYRVQAGDVLVVDKLAGEPGAGVRFDEVLMLGDGDAVVVGAPTIAGAAVEATLIETRKGVKIKVFKKIRRQGYRRTQGHRQHETVLRVTGLVSEGKSDKWDGEVDLTPRSAINARARGLKIAAAEYAPATEAKAAAKPAKAKAKPVEEVAVTPAAVEVETVVAPEKKAPKVKAAVVETAEPVAEAAPKKKAAPKKAAPKAAKPEAAAPKKAAPKKAKPAADGDA